MGAERPEWEETIVGSIVQFDRTKLDPWLGVVVAVAIAVPLAVGLATPWVTSAVMAALGAFNLFLGIGGMPTRDRWRAVLLALGLNALGLALGTVVASTNGPVLLEVAIGIAAFSAVHVIPSGRWAAITAAALFAVGFGLPDASLSVAGLRGLLALAGGGWAIALGMLALWLRRMRSPRSRSPRGRLAGPLPTIDLRTGLIGSAVTGIAAAAAYGIAVALGLPRDYWTILTVVVVFQTGMLAAIATSSARVAGTLAGAVLGGAIAVAVVGPAALTIVIGALAGAALAARPASSAIYAVLLTPFVIVLLNLSFPGGWELAASRVIDTLVGAGCALAATELLCWLTPRIVRRHRAGTSPG